MREKGLELVDWSNGCAVIAAAATAIPAISFPGTMRYFLHDVFFVVFPSVVVFIALSYLLARKIQDCSIPFYRVIFIWTYFCAFIDGLIVPIKITIKIGWNDVSLMYFICGIVFATFSGLIILRIKALEPKNNSTNISTGTGS